MLPYLPYVAGSARHATSCPQTGQVDHDPHQGASWVSRCHTRATQRCRCRGRSSNARTGCALVPAHRQGRGTTTLTWGRGSPLLSLQGHKCLPTDRAGAPRTTHVEGAHHCYTAGSQVQATLPCTCGCQHWLIRSAILPVNADRLALCKPEYVRRIAPLPHGFEADHLQLRRCCHAQRIRQLFAAARKAVGDVVVD